MTTTTTLPETPAMDALAAAAAAVEAPASPSPLVFVRVEIGFARGQAAPVSRREMGDALAAIRAGFEAAGFARTWCRNPHGGPVARVVAGGRRGSVRLGGVQRMIREAVAEIGFPRVSLTVDGERVPVFLSTLDDVPEHLRLVALDRD